MFSEIFVELCIARVNSKSLLGAGGEGEFVYTDHINTISNMI